MLRGQYSKHTALTNKDYNQISLELSFLTQMNFLISLSLMANTWRGKKITFILFKLAVMINKTINLHGAHT